MTALAERTIEVTPLSEREATALEFIAAYIAENEIGPTYAEIGRAIGAPGKAVVKKVLDALERRGYIRKLIARARAIEVVKPAPVIDGSDGPFAAMIMAFFPEIGLSENEAHGLSRQTRINSRKPPRRPYSHEIPDFTNIQPTK